MFGDVVQFAISKAMIEMKPRIELCWILWPG
jgi:hypothetical protein